MKLENTIKDEDYNLSHILKARFLAIPLIFIFIGFIVNYPLTSKIENILKSTLLANPQCPISYKESKLEFFFKPSLTLKNLSMPGRCLNENKMDNIELPQLKISFVNFSISPFGVITKLTTSLGASRIQSEQILGASEQIIKTSGTSFDLKTLMPLLGSNFKMEGKVEATALIDLKAEKISNIKFLLKSKDFVIPAQRLNSFDLPQMNIKNLSIKGTYLQSGKVTIDQLVLTDQGSPINANFKGSILINRNQFSLSNLDLNGELKFDETFLNNISILKLFLNQFAQKDGYYQIKLGGTIASPMPLQ